MDLNKHHPVGIDTAAGVRGGAPTTVSRQPTMCSTHACLSWTPWHEHLS